MIIDEPTREEIEAAARRLWRDEHGFRCISSHDSKRTRESDEQEMDRAFRQWDRGAVSDPVKDGYRSKGRNALIAAREVRSEATIKAETLREAAVIARNWWVDPHDAHEDCAECHIARLIAATLDDCADKLERGADE